MKRKIEMTLEEAKKLYENGSDDIKNLLLTTFAKEELESPKKPKDWEDLVTVSGYWVEEGSETICIKAHCCNRIKNIFPKKEQAEASIALAQLLQLMQHPYWNGDWEPDWGDCKIKRAITFHHEKPQIGGVIGTRNLLTFAMKAKAQEFLESYKDLIEIAKPLL